MLSERVDHLIKKYRINQYFSGAVCTIVQGESILHVQEYGYSTITPQAEQMQKGTVFDIASLTKIVTSTITLRLVTEGKLELDQTIDQYFESRILSSNVMNRFQTITVKQLLTHSSGLIDWYPFYTNRNLAFFDGLERIISSHDIVREVKYSDLNFMILGELISQVTGLALDEAVRMYVTQPLQLNSMMYSPYLTEHSAATEYGNQIEQDMVRTRGLSFEGWRSTQQAIHAEVNDGNAYYYFNGIAGHAGLFASANDLLTLGQLYIQNGTWQGQVLINSHLVRESMREQVHSRGLGWQISSIYPQGCGHTGFTGTSMWIWPEKEIVVVLLTNRLHTTSPKNIQDLRRALHEIVYDKFK